MEILLLTGMNGGATFILVYLLSTLVVGLPVMITELVMGRTAKADAIGTLRSWRLTSLGGSWALRGF